MSEANASNAQAETVQWKSDPYKGNDINPGTVDGRKIFEKKTQGLPEESRLDLTKSNASEIHQFFKSRSENLGQSILIPVEFNSDGSVKSSKNLLNQYHSISEQDMIRRAHNRWSTQIDPSDPIPTGRPFTLRDIDPGSNDDDKKVFFDRVGANIVRELIKNCLSSRGYLDLLQNKKDFTFSKGSDSEYDGPTMLFFLIQKIDPSTNVGLDSILETLGATKLGDYKNDVDQMITRMTDDYNILKDNNAAPRNIRKLLLTALKSGPNHDFNSFIQRIEDDVDSGIGQHKNISVDDLITASRTKYNNMEKKNTWNQVDPRDAQMMALTTELKQLKERRNQYQPHDKTKVKQSDPQEIVPGTSVQKWRTKYDGDAKTVDGKKWYWCRLHKLEGKWDGLYVGHTEENHKGKGKATTFTPKEKTDTASKTSQSQLQLNSRLKQVMCTNFCLSEEDVDKIFDEASSEN